MQRTYQFPLPRGGEFRLTLQVTARKTRYGLHTTVHVAATGFDPPQGGATEFPHAPQDPYPHDLVVDTITEVVAAAKAAVIAWLKDAKASAAEFETRCTALTAAWAAAEQVADLLPEDLTAYEEPSFVAALKPPAYRRLVQERKVVTA